MSMENAIKQKEKQLKSYKKQLNDANKKRTKAINEKMDMVNADIKKLKFKLKKETPSLQYIEDDNIEDDNPPVAKIKDKSFADTWAEARGD